jgi:ADP-heptose:LPS heptosyltransferase
MAEAAKLLPEPGRALALGPTANWHGKQWPAERFAQLTQRLTAPGAPFADVPILVLGGPGEEEAAAPLLNAIPEGRRIALMGTADLLTAYAVLARARLYIGNDSGLMHLAAAAGIPTLGLFGPSNDAHYAPFGPNTAIVRGEPFATIVNAPDYDRFALRSYMDAVSVDAVEEAALALLRQSAT